MVNRQVLACFAYRCTLELHVSWIGLTFSQHTPVGTIFMIQFASFQQISLFGILGNAFFHILLGFLNSGTNFIPPFGINHLLHAQIQFNVTTNHATLLALFQHVPWVGFAFSCGGPHITGFVIVGTLCLFVVCFIIIISNNIMMMMMQVIFVVVVVGSMFHGGGITFLFGRKSIIGGIARAIIIRRTIVLMIGITDVIITFDKNPTSMIAECDIFQRTNNTVFVIEATTRNNGCHQQQEQAGLGVLPPFRRPPRHRDRG
mmetsp:Transcript_4636/g.8540  ORF Transcript_4636/g.8540 Transcript_4636/m.8540 type:complete len:259 (-) Transcript_4636:7-783(-)